MWDILSGAQDQEERAKRVPTDFGELLPDRPAAVLPRLPKYYNLLLESVYRWKLITSHHRTRIIPLEAPNSATVV